MATKSDNTIQHWVNAVDQCIEEQGLGAACGCAPLWRCKHHAYLKKVGHPDAKSEFVVNEKWRANEPLSGLLSRYHGGGSRGCANSETGANPGALTSTSSALSRTCQVCKKQFRAQRRSARFCSPMCSKRHQRRTATVSTTADRKASVRA